MLLNSVFRVCTGRLVPARFVLEARRKGSKKISLNADIYNEHNSMQRRHATEFFSMLKERMNWGDASGETIMDIGCGTGNTSTQLILGMFPQVKTVIATDVSEDMIRLAKSQNSHPKVEYFVADIQDASANRRWFGTVSKAVSVYCLHWAKDQTQAFRTVFNVLKPSGEAALLFSLKAPNWDAYESMKTHPRWKEITQDVSTGIPESHIKNLDSLHFHRIFSDIGFDVALCEDEQRLYLLPDDEKFKGFLSGLCPLLKYIPNHLRDEFEEDLLKEGLKSCGRSSDGHPKFSFTAIQVLLRRPFDSENSCA